MPAQAKSPRSAKKNIGPAKNKGAVRAKSGCYTCRIRRKKCDERKIGEDGPCETCFRLKLECLGFGAKRPDWLRESNKVSAIREQIKNHLASQGMIKGHSGSGSRNAVHLDTLILSEYKDADVPPHNGSASDSSDSPHRELTPDSETHHYARYTNMIIPAQRSAGAYGGYEEVAFHHRPLHHPYTHHYEHPMDMGPSRCVSPSSMSSHHNYHDGIMPDSHAFHISPLTTYDTPVRQSNLSRLYDESYVNSLLTMEPTEGSDGANMYPDVPIYHIHTSPAFFLTQHTIEESVQVYVNNVVKIQFLLGDGETLPRIILESVKTHELSHETVSLLSKIHQWRRNNPSASALEDREIRERLKAVEQRLLHIDDGPDTTMQVDSYHITPDDAMAALNSISLYLFDGGTGKWYQFLKYAATFVEKLLAKQAPGVPHRIALSRFPDKTQFIIKTTIWFDVLASISTLGSPLLINFIRQLFDPMLNLYTNDPPSFTMLVPMGCSNDVLWAMAEAASLAAWKKKHIQKGNLSILDLVARGKNILKFLYPPCNQPMPPNRPPQELARQLSSEMFRAAARLFVQSIIAGDYPNVREIRQCVEEIMSLIRSLPDDESRPVIVRSTVFPVFICGALTDNPKYQGILEKLLEQGKGDDAVGNCPKILMILQKLWREKEKKPTGAPVQWRKELKDNLMLLV